MNIATARRFQDLLVQGVTDPHYQFDQIFSDQGMIARSHSKRKFKILKALDPLLSQMLFEDESVDFITWGTQTTFLDFYMLGWWMFLLNHSAIVFTSHRIIMIRIDSRKKPRDVIWQIRFDSVKKVGRTMLGALRIVTRDRKKVVFWRMPGRDRKFMRETLKSLQASGELEDSGVRGKENLCPHCWVVVIGRPNACEHCRGEFKTVGGAMWRSLLFPGLGDWYLGHKRFALLEMLPAAFMWFCCVVLLFDESSRTADFRLWPDMILGSLFFFGGMHVFDSAFTGRVASAGIYPGRAANPVSP